MGFSPSGIGTTGTVSVSLPTSVATPVVSNVAVPAANTEYAIVFPINTKRFELRSRLLATIKVAYVSGETTTNFLTVDFGSVYSERDLALSGVLTLYFQGNKSSDIIEVLTWS